MKLPLSQKDFERLPLIVIIFFAGGILSYFSLKSEPSFIFIMFMLMAALIAIWLLTFTEIIKLPLFCIIFYIFGFFIILIKAHVINHQNLSFSNDHPYEVIAEIKNLSFMDNHCKVIVKTHNIINIDNKIIPRNIKITDNSCILKKFKIGDIIKFQTTLYGKFTPYFMPSNYNLMRHFYFKKIDAFGKIFENSEILQINSHSNKKIENLRINIYEHLTHVMGKDYGNLAASLIIGKIAEINPEINNKIRESGLSHLFAISGMHMSFISLIFFLMIRKALNLFPKIYLNHNVKKIAAVFAIFAGMFYLILANFPISAQRAFLMSSLIFGAIILDIQPNPFRILFSAIFIILLFWPESIMEIGFQMSVMSVLALISSYESIKIPHSNSYIKKVIFYVLGIILTSIVASFVTTPLAYFYFGKYAIYGTIANVMAIPLMSFIIMPIAIISLITYPLSISEFPLLLMKKSLILLVDIAQYTSSIDSNITMNDSFMTNPLTAKILFLIMLSFVWYFIFHSKIKYFSLIVLLFALSKLNSSPIAIIIDSSSRNIFFLNDNNQYEACFMLPISKIDMLANAKYPSSPQRSYVKLNKFQHDIIINTLRNKDKSKIYKLDLQIYNSKRLFKINQNDLKNMGTYFITFHNNNFKITKYTNQSRIW